MTAIESPAPSLFDENFPAGEFAARRQKLLDNLEKDASILIQGAGPVDRSEAFRQTNEFYYLCGVQVPQAYLLWDGRSGQWILFLGHRNERQERNEGPGLAAEDESAIRAFAGVDAVRPREALVKLIPEDGLLYTPHSPAEGRAMYRDELLDTARLIASDPWDARTPREQLFIERLRSRFPRLEIRDLSPVLDGLRQVKSPHEIVRMREAGRLTALGVTAAMRATRPGMREYQLGAITQSIHRSGGASGEGYTPIIASGPNIWYTHYSRNDRVLEEGDMVLMGYAPDYHYYTSDIGRAWPVGGRYSPLQRELYSFITEYHRTLLARIRPRVLPAKILEEAAAVMAPWLEKPGFSKSIYTDAARRALAFRGHLSHPVGMAVHDVGRYGDHRLTPGLVFSVDPQLWIPEEQLYVRVEDTVVVTAEGCENLTALAPLDLDEIEATVGAG